MDLNNSTIVDAFGLNVSLREKGVDLNRAYVYAGEHQMVSLREKGVDLNAQILASQVTGYQSPFVRREWI